MRIKLQSSPQGIALIIVMVVVVVFGILAGGFAYSMKVETKLARNSTMDTEMEWLGRSGIELAKCFLSQPGAGGGQYDALNQKWAGGTAETNDALAGLSLEGNELGNGKFSVKIVDLDRKFNINVAGDEILRQAMILIGTDAAETPRVVNAILDWRDPVFLGRVAFIKLLTVPKPVWKKVFSRNPALRMLNNGLKKHSRKSKRYWGCKSCLTRCLCSLLHPCNHGVLNRVLMSETPNSSQAKAV